MSASGDIERRGVSEMRAAGRQLSGYAATFGAEARIGRIVETIAPGAFRESLSGDVLALLDHDTGRVLGRTRSGTLRIWEDSKGLAFELTLPDTSIGRDVVALAERGDLGGMSFGFLVPTGGDVWNGERRTLRTVWLKEISVVQAWPAYPDTEIALRALQRVSSADRRRRAIALAEAGKWA